MTLTEQEIKDKLKQLIVTRLRLDRDPSSIADDEILFVQGLGLDSIDSLEIIIGCEKEFQVTFPEKDMEKPEEIFFSLDTLAKYVKSRMEATAE